MIRHIVMFRLKNPGNNKNPDKIKVEVKRRIDALPSKIDVIRSMEVGINIVKSERAWDMVLVSSFDNMEDLEIYRVHPEHQKVLAFLRSVWEQVAAVDYEI